MGPAGIVTVAFVSFCLLIVLVIVLIGKLPGVHLIVIYVICGDVIGLFYV